jgi:Cu/Ag efflux pump CusA
LRAGYREQQTRVEISLMATTLPTIGGGNMQSSDIDPAALGFTVVSLSVALEEVLKALAEKNNNQPGPWLDEVEDLAMLRARARLAQSNPQDAAAAALGAVEAIFDRMRSGYSNNA